MLLALIAAAQFSVATAAERAPKKLNPLKLPTAAGKLVAETTGQPQMEVSRLVGSDDAAEGPSPANPISKREISASMRSTPEIAATPAGKPVSDDLKFSESNVPGHPGIWKVRGTVTQDEYVYRRDYAGNPLDVWGLESWRFDAALTRNF